MRTPIGRADRFKIDCGVSSPYASSTLAASTNSHNISNISFKRKPTMSKLKRAQKYIGKKIKYRGNVYLIEDVVYVTVEDSRHTVLRAPIGLCFKTAINEDELADTKAYLEELQDRFFKIDAGLIASAYATKEQLMAATLSNIQDIQAQLEHPDGNNEFIRVNSRCRHEIVD